MVKLIDNDELRWQT